MKRNIKQHKDFETPLSVTDLIDLHDSAVTVFQPKWEAAEDNERRWLAENWSEEGKQKHKDQNRQSFSMPIILHKLRNISAMKGKNKSEWKVEASADPRDEIKAELATMKLKDVAKKSDWNFLQTDIFDSGMAVCYGATKINLDNDKYGNDFVRIDKLDWRDVIWDSNSKKYNVREDALWIANIEKVYRANIRQEFGDEAANHSLEESSTTFAGRDINSYYIARNEHGKQDFDIITKFHHYQRVMRDYYCVVFEDPFNFFSTQDGIYYKEFRSKSEAEKELKRLNQPYLVNGEMFSGSVEKKSLEKIDYYCFVYDKILKYEETDLDSAPIDIYFSFRFEDQFISMMDFMKSPQIFIDRMWSQIDYSIGTDLKKVHQIHEDLLSERNPAAQAKAIAEKGGVLFVNGMPGQDVIKTIEGRGANQQFFQIAQILQGYLEDFGGGRSFSGLQDDQGESGKAIRLKQQAGMMVAFKLIENFSRYMQALGDNVLSWVSKFDTSERTVRVHGNDLSPEMIELLQKNEIYSPSQTSQGGYVTLNREGLSFLDDAEMELTVVETELSDEERTVRRAQLLELISIDPLLNESPTMKAEILKTYNLEPSVVSKIQEEREQIAQRQAEMAQEASNIEKAKVLAGMKTEQPKKATNEAN